jgi:Sec-independent protein secretion pathway component TatC
MLTPAAFATSRSVISLQTLAFTEFILEPPEWFVKAGEYLADGAWKGKDVKFGPVLILSTVLLAVGVLLTFPPVFELIAGG